MPNIKLEYIEKDGSVNTKTYRNAQTQTVPYIFLDVFNVKTGKCIQRYYRNSIISIELLRPASNEQISTLVDKY